MKQTLSITRKELSAYFGSPMALIFVGAFLAVTLFTFFWVDTFFARGIADMRPMFRWMPVLMIFLVAALTMRQWSEEQRSGTLEVLLTLPVSKVQLVLGKFLAVMALVALALALTLFLPITVALLGPLDWGPVIGGYLAALLMASAYTAIGLFISSRTDNQLVALILTVIVSGFFYLIGSSGVTDFVPSAPGRHPACARRGQPLREHRARRDRPARPAVLPGHRRHLPCAQRPVGRPQAVEQGRGGSALSPQRHPDLRPAGRQPGPAERLAVPPQRPAPGPDRAEGLQPLADDEGAARRPAPSRC